MKTRDELLAYLDEIMHEMSDATGKD